MEDHYRKLEWMYLNEAPVNKYYKPKIKIMEGHAEVSIDSDPKFFHAANAVHGSVYFKMLDDAAFFAVNSLVNDVFVLTTSFTSIPIYRDFFGRIRLDLDVSLKSLLVFLRTLCSFSKTMKMEYRRIGILK